MSWKTRERKRKCVNETPQLFQNQLTEYAPKVSDFSSKSSYSQLLDGYRDLALLFAEYMGVRYLFPQLPR
jgi:hypothetical protein